MLTISETAKEFNLPLNFVRRAVLDGKVAHVKAGKKYLLNAEVFTQYLTVGDIQSTPQTAGQIRRVAQ